jgi:antitoxin (DNA-binding transcriptional repressor) of toxin-antitoxin stability system
MAVIHISEADAARDFPGLMAHVRAGAEIVIESDTRAVAVVRPAGREISGLPAASDQAGGEFKPRLISESIALAKKHADNAKHFRSIPGLTVITL